MNESELQTLALLGLNEELRGQQFQIGRRTSIGRSISSDIFLPDPTIGRHHCQIEQNEHGLELFATARHAHVLVNGRAVRNATLAIGDSVEIGRFQLRLVRAGSSDCSIYSSPRHDAAAAESTAPLECLGVVWIVRAAIGAVSEHVGEVFDNLGDLLDRMEDAVAREGGETIRCDLPCRYAFWPCSPGQLQEKWQAASRLALQLRQLAFLYREPAEMPPLCQVVAAGPCYSWQQAEQTFVWGPAVDRCHLQALSTATDEICLSDHDDLETVRESILATDGIDGVRSLHGVWLTSEGRRLKLDLAEPATLSRFGLHLRAMIVRALHDPETQKLTLTLQCHAPLELDAEYVVCTRQGQPMSLVCSTTRQEAMKSVQAQFSCIAPVDSLATLLGLSNISSTRTSISQAA